MAEMNLPSVAHFNRRCYENFVAVALSTTTARCELTQGNLYVAWASVPWHVNQGRATAVTALTSHSQLAAYQPIEIWSRDELTDGLAGILDSSTGTLWVLRVT